ncbi:MAG: lytic transglycosylase domain-containing protein [Proteobacteria bacterium]|nr:lytic transglycosylase domain-containing protein [Pseudomonadota bacterium]
MKRIFLFTAFAFLMSLPSLAMADIYRYMTADGEIILTTEPRKGLKLLEVIRDSSKPGPQRIAAPQTSPKPNSAAPATAKKTPYRDASHDYDAYILEASKMYGIPVAFIKAVIKIESNFNPRAVSRVGAMGLMQLMPATAEHMQVTDPFDPHQNILGGTKYLRRLSDRYDGDINLILSGYHAGPGNVAKAGGIPFEKTQQYVRNVYNWYVRYREEGN